MTDSSPQSELRTDVHAGPAGPIGVLTLTRPDRRNAMTPAMLREFPIAASTLASSCRVVVIAGAGKTFCSGFDLSLCKNSPDGAVLRELLTGLYDSIDALRALHVPVIAAVQGAAIAGACALLGGCDFVITHDQASLGYPVARLGISPAVSAPFLASSIGPGPARERLLDTGLITGARARSIGLASESLQSPDLVLPRALELAATLADKPPEAIAATRCWLMELDRHRIETSKALEASLALTGGPEERERLAAFWTANPNR